MKIIESIKISEIDMNKCYWNPGCAMSIYKPELSEEILKILRENFGNVKLHSICCQHNPNLEYGSTIINNCAGCDRRFRSLYEGIKTISLWEILDSIENLKLPDHQGLVVSVHDSCSYREKPQEQQALRSILKKMNIEIVESEFTGSNAVCCGDSFYGKVSIEKLHQLQKNRADQMPCENVVVQCVTCIKSMKIGGKTPCYLPDLILNKPTQPQTLDMVEYHNDLQKYVDKH